MFGEIVQLDVTDNVGNIKSKRSMFEKVKYHGLQKLMNSVNQFKKITPDWVQSEELYNRIYMDHILSEIKKKSGNGVSLNILDGGCGTGEMAIELATAGHQVTGIELHKPSVEAASQKSTEAGVSVNWILGDLYDSLKEQPTASFDVVMSIGVLYTCTQYKEILEEYSRILRPGGVLIASFKSKFYFITSLLRQKQYDKAVSIMTESEGILKLTTAPTYYNWQTGEELELLYKCNQLKTTLQRAVGIYSGAGTDGLAAVIDVDQTPSDIVHSFLYQLESPEPKESLGSGRYILAIGRKTPEGLDSMES